MLLIALYTVAVIITLCVYSNTTSCMQQRNIGTADRRGNIKERFMYEVWLVIIPSQGQGCSE